MQTDHDTFLNVLSCCGVFQVQMLLDIERSMPTFFLKHVQVEGYSEFPNHAQSIRAKVTINKC